MGDIFDEALKESTQENPLTAPAAGRMITMTLVRHATVKEAASRGGAAAATAGRHSRFGGGENPFAGAFGASTDLPAAGEEEDESGEDVEYDDPGEISVTVNLPAVREYFGKLERRHKDPVGQPQQWFDILIGNRTMKLWTRSDQEPPPKGWVQDGWEGMDAEDVKDHYSLLLVLKGAINELLTNADIPESQQEDLSLLLRGIRLYRQADEHMEKIADKLDPLIAAGFTFIRKTSVRLTSASPSGGGSQTLKIARPRQLAALNSSMNSRTIEATLVSWKTYPNQDLSQYTLGKAVEKLPKKTRETESLSDKLSLFYKIARERPDSDPLAFPSKGTDDEKEEWDAREARLWIEKVKPIYVEDVDWSLTVEAFEKAKKDTTESNLNFTTRLKAMWDTMQETCARESAAVIPHSFKDEPGLVAHSISLMNKDMMEEIFKDRIKDGKEGAPTEYSEFKGLILTYEQRKRAVNAMLGTVSAPVRTPAQPPGTLPPAGGGRGLAGAMRGGRARGAVRQLVPGGRGGRGGGGQGVTPPAAQDGARTPGQGADGLPRLV